VDLLTHPDEIKAMLRRGEADYFAIYNDAYERLRAAGQPITTWTHLLDEGRFYVPSNDFACMVSNAMFREFFLPGIVNECRFYSRSIYHLDGPNALRYLDTLLEIPELDAIQWVFGAGNEGFHRWVDVYRRVQAAHKGIQVICDYAELPAVMETLDPRGLFLSVGAVPSREAGLDMLRRLEAWCAGRTFLAIAGAG
jgi:hypothetical protein